MTQRKLGEILIHMNKIDEIQLRAALGYQRKWGKKLGRCLLDLNLVSEVSLFEGLSEHFKIPLICLNEILAADITPQLLSFISVKEAHENKVVPIGIRSIRRRTHLIVATSNPRQLLFFFHLRIKTMLPILALLATDRDIDGFIRQYYFPKGERRSRKAIVVL